MWRLHVTTPILRRSASLLNLALQANKPAYLHTPGYYQQSLILGQKSRQCATFLQSKYQVTQHTTCRTYTSNTSGGDGIHMKESLHSKEQEELKSFEDDFFGPEIEESVPDTVKHPEPLSAIFNRKTKVTLQQDVAQGIERKRYGYIQHTDRVEEPKQWTKGKGKKPKKSLDARGNFRIDEFLEESRTDRNSTSNSLLDGSRSSKKRVGRFNPPQQLERTYKYGYNYRPDAERNRLSDMLETSTNFQQAPTRQDRLRSASPTTVPSHLHLFPEGKEKGKHEHSHTPKEDAGTEETNSTAAPYNDEDDFDPKFAEQDEDFGTVARDRYKRRWYRRDADVEEYIDSDEEVEKRHQRPPGQSRHTCQWYGNRMKELAKAGKLPEAIDMLETRMLKEDRVQPNEYVYNVLIGACGRTGFSQKAFELFFKMKERGLHPGMVTFTALLNACAESPFNKTNELGNIIRVRQEMAKRDIQPNMITYNAMLKAYAKCADLPAALELFQEIIQSGQEVTAKTFSFLLFASTEDREAGFTQTVEAWRLMKKSHIKPDIFIYNLLLRAARDCGIGQHEVAERILLGESDMKGIPTPRRKKIHVGPKLIKGSKGAKQLSAGQGSEVVSKEMLTVEPVREADMQQDSQADELWKERSPHGRNTKTHGRSPETEIKAVAPTQSVPSLLNQQTGMENVVSLGRVQTPADRLGLLGGVGGFLSSMEADGVKPNIKTFCQMLEIIRPNTREETDLMVAMDEHGVKPDRDFYNALIRKRAMRRDMEAAKAVLPMMSERRHSPNLRTYVNMAMACTNSQEGFKLLREVKQAGFAPNVQLFTALMKAALSSKDYIYAKDLIMEMERQNVAPDQLLIKKLEKAAEDYKGPQKGPFRSPLNIYLSKVHAFRSVYKHWLERMPVAQEEHPWDKYRKTPSQEGDAAAK
ncbi:pentatricopeptide repeat-containing protein 1, mitochondrial-like [Branchiostoma floridae]|uniref:Pentatricopeptide repeat-containing protein 1, mitochondrial-like n=1 Tax=Branchiostoma floridae TaxID=7739 RepID=A0A9J7M6Z7_BRAFL|nr:pentatricopeptide repeat-containing protein 1, mitochondrial-like [Branchiostoma floridae]